MGRSPRLPLAWKLPFSDRRRWSTLDGLAMTWIDLACRVRLWIAQAGAGSATLLNVLERQLPAAALLTCIPALLVAKFLHDTVKVAAKGGYGGAVGAEGGFGDLQGALQLLTGGRQVAQVA